MVAFIASEVNSKSDNVPFNKLISEYKVAFSGELGTLKDFQADIATYPKVNPNILSLVLYRIVLRRKLNTNLNISKIGKHS